MPWAEVRVCLPGDFSAGAEALLESLGALALTLVDPADRPVLEPAPGETPLWPVVELRGLFEAQVDRAAVVQRLLETPDIGGVSEISWRVVEDRDWERAWMDRFRPMRFGERLWIVPGGMAGVAPGNPSAFPPSLGVEAPADPDAVIVKLDPGLAFGTGTHPTTAQCLEWIDGQEMNGRIVIDYGCGSGVLGIAAALKGARQVVSIDIDPQALEATAENARRNGVAARILCQEPGEAHGDAADVLFANILAGTLVELAPRLGACLRPGGRIVLAGILAEQADAVAAAYAVDFGQMTHVIREGWVRLEGVRKS